ncbi:energy-coupling factor transporter ATPase [Macrococcoides canis]|uniref:energy-coupling factor transporter ATPase n=1 Tax=Macrococcoides canis TaxID=1855823 RepID=UPI0013E97F38|nr:energy-coupling factor transporter ATPase [Macrococcus canis]QIH74987.1 energy-coupling factor transporter ATPase [Macrococcus canis]UTH07120.1 energy-coupling factor transporter ATPase [Macrococcus canis]
MTITLNNLGYYYSKGTPFEVRALYNIDMQIDSHLFYGIIGHTGSGKSTVIQHFNALVKPTEGSITIDGLTITDKTKNKYLKPIRKKVGMVFQFAEQQLFEETVLKDIMFGPLNYGVAPEDAKRRAYELVNQLGMDESILEKSPFELSGGQMRRVAIMGVLAMNPEVLILDEPTAGLDPKGQQEIMDMFHKLQRDLNITVILVTHQMEQAARCDHLFVMHQGTVVDEGTPEAIFSKDLSHYDIHPPHIVTLQRQVEAKHHIKFPKLALSLEAFAEMYKDWRNANAR